MFYLSIDGTDVTTLQPVVVDPALLPSRPVISVAFSAYKTLFIKWVLESNNNDGFDQVINQITITFLRYNSGGLLNAVSQGKIILSKNNQCCENNTHLYFHLKFIP